MNIYSGSDGKVNNMYKLLQENVFKNSETVFCFFLINTDGQKRLNKWKRYQYGKSCLKFSLIEITIIFQAAGHCLVCTYA